MRNNSLVESWFINDFHRKNSMAAQREVQQMSLHPCSREQKFRESSSTQRLPKRVQTWSAARSCNRKVGKSSGISQKVFLSGQTRFDKNKKRKSVRLSFLFVCAQWNQFFCGTCQDTDMNRRVGGNPPLFLIYKSGELRF